MRISFEGKSLPCVISHYSDIQVLQQVFVWEQYKLDPPVDPRVIFGAPVVCVEALDAQARPAPRISWKLRAAAALSATRG